MIWHFLQHRTYRAFQLSHSQIQRLDDAQHPKMWFSDKLINIELRVNLTKNRKKNSISKVTTWYTWTLLVEIVARAGRVGLTGWLDWLATRFAVFVIWPKTGLLWADGFRAKVGLIAGIDFWGGFDEAKFLNIFKSQAGGGHFLGPRCHNHFFRTRTLDF